MKSLFKLVEFVSPRSLPIVRMTLRELCGSAFEGNYPFRDDSEVEDTSFKLVEDFRGRRHFPLKRLDILGVMSEENDGTRIIVTAQSHEGNKPLAIIIFACLLVITAIIFSVIAGPPGIAALIFVAIFYCAIWPLFYLIAYLRFKRFVRKIKDALEVE